MKYTPEDLERDMKAIEDGDRAIREDRGRKYGGKDDTLQNVAEFGADGAIVLFWKFVRQIRNMHGKPKDPKDLANSIHDARNYLAYIQILENRQGNTEHPKIKSFEESRNDL